MVDYSLDRTSETQNAPTFDSVWQEVARENSGFGKGLQAEARLIKGAVSNIVPGIKEAAQHAIENPLGTGVKLVGMVALGYGLGMVSRASLLHTAVRGAFAYALLADGVRPMVRSTSFVWDNRNDMALQYQQKQLGRGLGHFAFDLGLTLPAIGFGVKLARTPKLGAATPGDPAGIPRRPSGGGSSGGGSGSRVDVTTETTSPVAETRTSASEVRVADAAVEQPVPAPEVSRPSVSDGSSGEASPTGMSSPRSLHEAIMNLARVIKRPGVEPGGSAEVRAPEVVRPAEAEVRAPEVVRPADAEVRAPEVVRPAEAEVRAPEVVRPAEAEVRAPEVVAPAEAEVRAPEVVRPVEAEVRAPEVVAPAEAEVRAPEVVRPAEAEVRAPEVVRPAEAEVRAPEIRTPAEDSGPTSLNEPPVVQEVDVVIRPPAEPVRPVETKVEPAPEIVERPGTGNGSEVRTEAGGSAYEAVAPQGPPVAEQTPRSGGTAEPVKTGEALEQPAGGGKRKNEGKNSRPMPEKPQDDDPYAGLDAETRRIIEQDEIDFRQNRGRKPKRDRGGRNRGGKGGWDDDY